MKRLALMVVLMLVVLGLAAQMQKTPMNHTMTAKKEGMGLKHFNLTVEQKAQYEASLYTMKLEKIEIQADVKKLDIQYDHALKMADFAEAKKINKLLFQKKAALANLQLELKKKLYNLLDGQQKTLWNQPVASCKKNCIQRKISEGS